MTATTVSGNTAVGDNALRVNVAEYNTAVGAFAMDTNTTGTTCTAVGYAALDANSTGSHNTGIGAYALVANTTGAANVALGKGAGAGITTGSRNLAIGYNTYDSSDTENDNIAIGYQAMDANTAGGTKNIALGNYAGDALTSGDENVLIGYDAGTRINTAVQNICIGNDAGAQITNGTGNIILGRSAGASDVNLDSGDENILIGNFSDTNGANAQYQIALGYNVSCNGNNSFVFGNEGTDSAIAFGATSISAPSDVRLKEDIQDEKIGLDFINDLRPVTFQWKKAKDISSEMDLHDLDSDERVMNGKYNHGFIAQEVKETIDKYSDIKDGFGMWSEAGKDNRQRVGEGALMSIMVKAVQELSTQNADLLARIETLEG
jgi:hypothetical protein